jgi:hypothetical protein
MFCNAFVPLPLDCDGNFSPRLDLHSCHYRREKGESNTVSMGYPVVRRFVYGQDGQGFVPQSKLYVNPFGESGNIEPF